MNIRRDPGPCPVCGIAHSACTASTGPVVVSQLPARDAAETVAEQVQRTLSPGQVTSGTYTKRPGKK